MKLAIFLISLISTSVFAQTEKPECLPLINKNLSLLNYGTFDRPRVGVSKTTENDGSVAFNAPGSTKIIFSQGKITEFLHVAGMNVGVTINFDKSCSVTSVSGNSFGGPSVLTAKADVEDCKKLVAKASLPQPTFLSIGEQLSLGWCGEYFPNKLPSKDIQPAAPLLNPYNPHAATR